MSKNKFYLIILLVVGVMGGLFYFGILQEVQINEQDAGPFKVVYETHLGDYSEISSIRNEIYNSLINEGINTTKSFGIYYDNPQDVLEERLRGEGGVIIEEKDYLKISELKSKYNVKDIPKSKNVIATFPYINDYSIMIGVFKVYPKLNKYIEEKGYIPTPAMEIYDSANGRIVYLMEIKR